MRFRDYIVLKVSIEKVRSILLEYYLGPLDLWFLMKSFFY